MGIDIARYHGWDGKLRSPWFACLAIVRVGLLQVFRRKSYWVVLGLGLLQFLVYWSVIYAVTQFTTEARTQQWLYRSIGFDPHPAAGQEGGYVEFMNRQSIVVMMLLAFSGSLLVGADFRQRSLPFYLSRRIDRRHYIVGKLLAVAAIVSLLTTLPALALFMEYGLFTASTEYWLNHLHVVGSILVYGVVLSVVLSILIVSLSAYLQKTAPIAITWASVFVLLGTAGRLLSEATGNRYWELVNLWRDVRIVGRLLFGTFRGPTDRALSQWALLILVVVCTAAFVALMRRIRAVDVVT